MFALFSPKWIIAGFVLAFWRGAALAAASGSDIAAKTSFIDNARLAILAQAEEKQLGARIGIAVLDETGGIIAAWRGYERFPLNSTHKPLLCAALL